jgi:hypothetical protein
VNQSKFSRDTTKSSSQQQSLAERRLRVRIVIHGNKNLFQRNRTVFNRNKSSAAARNKQSHCSRPARKRLCNRSVQPAFDAFPLVGSQHD